MKRRNSQVKKKEQPTNKAQQPTTKKIDGNITNNMKSQEKQVEGKMEIIKANVKEKQEKKLKITKKINLNEKAAEVKVENLKENAAPMSL